MTQITRGVSATAQLSCPPFPTNTSQSHSLYCDVASLGQFL